SRPASTNIFRPQGFTTYPCLASLRVLSCHSMRRQYALAISLQNRSASSSGKPDCLDSVLACPPYDQPGPSALAFTRYSLVFPVQSPCSSFSSPTTSRPHAVHALMM